MLLGTAGAQRCPQATECQHGAHGDRANQEGALTGSVLQKVPAAPKRHS